MNCGSCKYYDKNERWGGKGYCEYRRSYVDPDDAGCSAGETGSRISHGFGSSVRVLCKNCTHYDSSETWGSKGYCTLHRMYMQPDDTGCGSFGD